MTMIRDYFQKIYDSIPFSIDQIRSRADWRRWRGPTLQALRTCLGLEVLPPRTPLRPRVMGTLRRDGYSLQKVVFETRPGFLMTSNLYVPDGLKQPAPAILCVHGHSDLGKSNDEVQLRSIAYARAGWVVLAVDATGHGERVHIGHRRKFAIVTSGLALEGIQVWDNMRSVDYLLSRPEVDPARIGITGCSGGGNQTMYTAAMDDRIGMAVPACSVSTLRGQIFIPNSIGCDCECVPDVMRFGLENAVVCALIAPRRLLIVAGTQDVTFPIRFTRVAHRKLQRFYRAIGYGDRYALVERPVTHGYHPPLRQQGGEGFARWFGSTGFQPVRPAGHGHRLQTRATGAEHRLETCATTSSRYSERGSAPEPIARVWCFPGGKLPADSATLGTVACEAAGKLAAKLRLPATEAGRRALRAAIRDRVLGGFPARGDLKAKESRPVRRNGAVTWKVELTSEPGIRIFARVSRPMGQKGPCPCVVLVRPKPDRLPWPCTKDFLALGLAVAELDVRPLGEDEHASKAALVLGRPMVGMGAYDISRFADYLVGRSDFLPGRISLWAEDLMALPALYALALDDRLAGGTLAGLLGTYVWPVPVPHPTWTFARGILKYADIDHLLALVAARARGAAGAVVVAGPVGPDLQPLSAAALRKAFPAARKAFGRGERLQIIRGR